MEKYVFPEDKPKKQLTTQSTGWFRLSQSVATDPRLFEIEDEDKVLAALGLHIAALGLTLTRESDYITLTELQRGGVVPAASKTSKLEAAETLCRIGLWEISTLPAQEGYFIGGAIDAIAEKQARIDKARKAAEKRYSQPPKTVAHPITDGWEIEAPDVDEEIF